MKLLRWISAEEWGWLLYRLGRACHLKIHPECLLYEQPGGSGP